MPDNSARMQPTIASCIHLIGWHSTQQRQRVCCAASAFQTLLQKFPQQLFKLPVPISQLGSKHQAPDLPPSGWILPSTTPPRPSDHMTQMHHSRHSAAHESHTHACTHAAWLTCKHCDGAPRLAGSAITRCRLGAAAGPALQEQQHVLPSVLGAHLGQRPSAHQPACTSKSPGGSSQQTRAHQNHHTHNHHTLHAVHTAQHSTGHSTAQHPAAKPSTCVKRMHTLPHAAPPPNPHTPRTSPP